MCRGESGEGIHMETVATDGKRQVILYFIYREKDGASFSVSDVDRYVTITKFLYFIFNMLPVFVF
jgi:hypothetical protein